jgi:predicted lysophospholipase L1 biosynthesis ABC-type transport system permease subunit
MVKLLAAVFLAMLVLGLIIGPLVDRLISWYTGEPIPDTQTPLELLIQRIKRK